VILPVLRRFVALLLALALFAPASAFGRVLYACSMSGKVSAGRCCCHKAEAKQAADQVGQVRPAQVDRPGCCETQDHRRAALSAATSAIDVQVLAAAPTQLLPAVEPSRDAANVLQPHPHAARGPPPGSPVYVVNCSLLI
jgi:hypothetical protein